MSKYIYILLLALFFTSCSHSNLNSYSNYIDISKEKKQFTNDSCTFNSYILNTSNSLYGNIFIEQISLNSNCIWNGFQRSYFDNLFKEKNHIKTMVAIERMDFKNYEFSTYLINDKYIMNLIYEFSSNENTFIVDYSGKLFTKMIKQFDKNYKNIYLDEPRYSSDYNSSLVNQNIIKHYYKKDIDYP